MWTETSGIIGLGYEGHDITTFMAHLETWNVDVLVDVRLNAVSRKKGFSKKALTLVLAEAGIQYLHLPVLGNPKDNRTGFSNPGTETATTAHERYRKLLQTDDAHEAIVRLAVSSGKEHLGLLCFEASEACCHRSLVLDAVRAETASLSAV